MTNDKIKKFDELNISEKTCSNCKEWIYSNLTEDGICFKLNELLQVQCYEDGGVDYISTKGDFFCPAHKKK